MDEKSRGLCTRCRSEGRIEEYKEGLGVPINRLRLSACGLSGMWMDL